MGNYFIFFVMVSLVTANKMPLFYYILFNILFLKIYFFFSVLVYAQPESLAGCPLTWGVLVTHVSDFLL